LWRDILPKACFEADDAVLLGIGSIFREDYLGKPATENKRVFVLGSGAGTGPLPAQWPNDRWSILAVRGPLTGRLLGLPQAAVTDSAALLSIARDLLPIDAERRDIVFFPHYNSVQFSGWKEACALAGFVYADPHWPVDRVLRMLGGARLVVTEAMHGAIVADTLRIPWVPVVCSPAILPFKWSDWTRSVELAYRPRLLPPSSGWEALKHLKIRLTDRVHARSKNAAEEDQDLIDDFHRRFGNIAVEDLHPKPALNASKKSAVRAMTALFDPIFQARAANALIAAAKSDGYLSDDRIFANRVDRLQDALERLRRAIVT
jgi:succinoglycan biosynthesis protein ExoV